MSKIKITNLNQFEALVEHMKRNAEFARAFHKGLTKMDIKQEWNLLSTKLNGLGPPLRDGDGWQKVWIDFKGKVKKKIAHNKRESHATGGGIFNQKTLSPLEEIVANIMRFNELLHPVGMAIGTSSAVQIPPRPLPDPVPSTSAQALREETADDVSESVVVACTNNESSHKRHNKSQVELLVDQIAIQKDFFTEVHKSLKNIESHMKETERYNRKRYKLEEENLKLAREKFEWKKSRYAEREKNKK